MLSLFNSLAAVLIISLISIVLLSAVIAKIPQFSRISLSLVGVAVGSLLGDAFIHVLPEANRRLHHDLTVALLIILGMLLFFTLEKFVRWRHCHDPGCLDDEDNHGRHSRHIVSLSLVGESFHNFIDGVILASSFIISPALGWITSLAVLLHEIPQEIGHFGIFIHQGLTLSRALVLNLISASFAILGVIVTFLIGTSVANFSAYVLPVTAGGFIYLASSDLIPELHRHESNISSSLSQIVLVLLGVALMAGLLLLE